MERGEAPFWWAGWEERQYFKNRGGIFSEEGLAPLLDAPERELKISEPQIL